MVNKVNKFKIEHIQKSYRHSKKQVLKDVNVEAAMGQCIGILGANGCGKSTLLSILAGIQKPDQGSICIDERTITGSLKDLRSLIAYVPQENPLIEELTARDNLKLWYCNSVLNMEEELEQGVLAMLGIPEFLDVPVRQMSGGMKKRVSIGCSVANDQPILLLDEPGAALDLMCKERISVYLNVCKSQGKLIFLATHEEREIAMCDQLFVLKNGVLSPLTFDGNIHRLVAAL